jgi:hypothetical protein
MRHHPGYHRRHQAGNGCANKGLDAGFKTNSQNPLMQN